MAVERTYIVPLRREWLKVPRYKRAKKAIAGLKKFLSRHMKQEELSQIKLGSKLNEELWARGMRNPPHKVKINVVKEDDGLVKAELFGHRYIVKKKAEKKEEETGIAGKLKSALGRKEEKPEETEEKEEKKEEPKKEEKKAEVKKEKTAEKKEEKPAEKEVKKEVKAKKKEDKKSAAKPKPAKKAASKK